MANSGFAGPDCRSTGTSALQYRRGSFKTTLARAWNDVGRLCVLANTVTVNSGFATICRSSRDVFESVTERIELVVVCERQIQKLNSDAKRGRCRLQWLADEASTKNGVEMP